MCSARSGFFYTFAPKMQEQNKNRSSAEVTQTPVLTLSFGSDFSARRADFPLVLTLLRSLY